MNHDSEKSDKLSGNIHSAFSVVPKILILFAVGAFTLYLFSGIYSVGSSEEALVRRFGKVVKTTRPGIHFALPPPFTRIDKVKTKISRTLEVGAWISKEDSRALLKNTPTNSVIHNRYYLTGDKNIVHLKLILRYRARDPGKVLFKFENLKPILSDITQNIVIQILASASIDDVLTRSSLIQTQIQDKLKTRLTALACGIELQGLEIVRPHPPLETAAAFNDVTNAQEERKSSINEAKSFYNEIVPKSDAEATTIREISLAKANAITSQAAAEADKFSTILTTYNKNGVSTKTRMYLEMVEKVFPHMKKTIIDNKVKGKIKVFLK